MTPVSAPIGVPPLLDVRDLGVMFRTPDGVLEAVRRLSRSVYDVAVALGVMTGVDAADDATKKSEGKFDRDYTTYLKTASLKGARIGIARDFMGKDAGTDRVVEEAVVALNKLGAIVIDPIKYPDYVLQSNQALYNLITYAEFKAQIADYLKTTEPGYPKTLDDIGARATDPKTGYRSPEKAVALKYTASVALDLNDPIYLAARNEALGATRAAILALFAKHRLDAILYPTSPRPARLITPDGFLRRRTRRLRWRTRLAFPISSSPPA